ncbi:MAG: hypothetical protein L6R40_004453 [Gallowayella cf. fulva]|nr:MAG: hypothetical protein L6R40_004453 [Xanthomendoza cf. fulva]
MTTFADLSFHTFLSNESSSAFQDQAHDNTKTGQDNNTNLGYPQMEQPMRRETQQQGIMTRPGHYHTHGRKHSIEHTEAFETTPAVGTARAHSLQPPQERLIERPRTPPQQFNFAQFPITPDTSPHTLNITTKEILRSRTADSSPTRSTFHLGSTAACIDPSETMRRTTSYPDSKTSLEAELNRILDCTGPSPPAPAGLLPPPSFSHFPDISTLNMDFTVKGTEYDSSHYSPLSSALSPLISSFESSPEMTNMALFDNISSLPDLSLPARANGLHASESSSNLGPYPSPPKEKSHRRAQSEATVDIDGTNEETGVTEDEISAYIMGPLQENKYICVYEGCQKLFGRKENIRSHVQTHLGDRQWRCNHCQKRFVRQHDLKRHSKIHTGQKPHLCPCGNGFARHDALTRHRQRNTCIGGFGVIEGMPQSPSKRGRPKKRPDMESRRDKAARTRERALEKATSSSVSGSSDFSAASPEMFFEELTTGGGSSNADNMVTIQSSETDDVLEAVSAMSPELVEEYFRDISKGSSPFSEFEDGNTFFGADSNAFDMATTYDSTSAWLL